MYIYVVYIVYIYMYMLPASNSAVFQGIGMIKSDDKCFVVDRSKITH